MRGLLRSFFGNLILASGLSVSVLSIAVPRPAYAACANPGAGLPVSRVVQIDATNGPMYGTVTRQFHEPSFLKPKEVVLTFDDGPMPWVTKSILDTLDMFCTKATFFSVGRMALSYPATVKDVIARGHTLGSHTYSHPFNMPRMKPDAAKSEIERGLAAVAMAAGKPIAPFFRFTGLADSCRLLAYLQTRHLATFTVDVVSNDSYIHDPVKLADRTMAEVHRQHGGIILFHDIKTTTAKALPFILTRLKAEGYSVVHMVAKRPAEPLADAIAAVAPKLSSARNGEHGGKTLLPFYGAIGPDKDVSIRGPEVTVLTSPLRVRAASENAATKTATPKAAAKAKAVSAEAAADTTVWLTTGTEDETTGPPVFVDSGEADATTSGWIADIQPPADVIAPRHSNRSPAR